MGVENSTLVRLMIQRTGRCIYDLNSQVFLFSNLLILFFLTQNQLEPVLPTQCVVRIFHPVRSRRFVPSPCFIPSRYFPVRVLYLVRVLHPVRSSSPCFILTVQCSQKGRDVVYFQYSLHVNLIVQRFLGLIIKRMAVQIRSILCVDFNNAFESVFTRD